MAAVANNPAFAKKVGISKSVGEEFMKADKTKKFGSGGALKAVDSSDNPGLSKLPTEVRNKMGYMKKGGMAKKKMKMGGMAYKEGGKADMAQDKKTVKKAVGMHEKQLHGGKKSDLAALKKGGMAKKMAKGGGIEVRGKTKGTMVAMRSGGKADLAQDKKMAKKAVGMHEKQLHGGKKSDLAKLKHGGMAKMAKGGGIEKRGKTKGKMC